ncbi:MAG: hypothetical protein K5705_16650 [Oscillospiraceae bacterium]|nr:hypothetical protein [Oscillospiraceae bacterium]MCR4761874.1 hypothetical protein [Oscillospiraceae bacterium]
MNMHLRRLTAFLTAGLLAAGFLTAPADRSGCPVLQSHAAGVEIPGIDISKYQEEIDWKEVADSGIKFAILRCCKVIRTYDDWEFDSSFEKNYTDAKAAGLAVGCYLFTDAATIEEFEDDVTYMLGFLKDKSFEFPVFLDVESPVTQEHLPAETFMPALLTGLEKIEDAGHTAGVYSSSAFFSECIDRDQLIEAGYPIWEANYFNTTNGLPGPSGYDLSDEATIWQYSGCGRCPGIRTTVDRNICYSYTFFNRQAVITNSALPAGTLKAGSNFQLGGTVSSDAVLRTITGAIYAAGSDMEPLQTVTVYPHAREYKLTGFFTKKLIFSTIPEGSYELRISAVDSSGANINVVTAPFNVGPTEILPPDQGIPNGIGEELSGLDYHFAEEGHLHSAQDDSLRHANNPRSLRFTEWCFRHWSLRRSLTRATAIGCKCSLERTPLYRIVSGWFFRLESAYLAASIRARLVEKAQPAQ